MSATHAIRVVWDSVSEFVYARQRFKYLSGDQQLRSRERRGPAVEKTERRQ